MAENAEDRFKRAMDRLFSSPVPPSNAGRDSSKSGTRNKPTSKSNPGKLFSVEPSPFEANLSTNSHQVCRPWDRGDLFRRLATFKSMTWFGKPEVAGPVNCARNGWVNIDVDLISCEGCNAMLSFPCPSTWSQNEVDSAAASFSEKLESGHTAHCPWKANACSDTLAQFPPTPVEVLVDGFQNCCDALYQLSALPALANSTIDYLERLKGPQVEHFIAHSAPDIRLVHGTPEGSSATAYFQAQRIISLCGWELRLLPYAVDCEDGNAESLRTLLAESKARNARLMDSAPRVFLYSSSKERADQSEKGSTKTANQGQKCDLGSAVLDCSLCGASVGLWLFSKIPRPSSGARIESLLADIDSVACEVSAASEVQKESCDDQKGGNTKGSGKDDVATSNLSKVESKHVNVLTLKLTIAGGPRPTALPQPAGRRIISTSEDHNVQGNVKSISGMIEGNGGTGTIIKKRKRKGVNVEQKEATDQNARILPCLSSVNAVDTCFTCRPENSAESVEMPSRHPRSTSVSIEEIDRKRQRCPSDEAAEHAEGVGMSNQRSSLTPNVDTERGIEGTASTLLDGMYERRMSMEGSSRGHASPIEALHPQEQRSIFKEIIDESTREFDPILQHRHFCPWVNTNIGRAGCGWQLTLDALEASPAAVKSESASSMYNANPLSSVRKIFGKSHKS